MRIVFFLALMFAARLGYAQGAYNEIAEASRDTMKEAGMSFRLPNEKWRLVDSGGSDVKRYVFNREELTDSLGRSSAAAIVVAVEDAKNYNGDLILYSTSIRVDLSNNIAIDIKEVLSWETKDWPLPYKNAVFYKASYSENGLEHLLYMIHIINKHNKGIQIYMDMPQSLAAGYEHEFIDFLKSVKEVERKLSPKKKGKK